MKYVVSFLFTIICYMIGTILQALSFILKFIWHLNYKKSLFSTPDPARPTETGKIITVRFDKTLELVSDIKFTTDNCGPY